MEGIIYHVFKKKLNILGEMENEPYMWLICFDQRYQKKDKGSFYLWCVASDDESLKDPPIEQDEQWAQEWHDSLQSQTHEFKD